MKIIQYAVLVLFFTAMSAFYITLVDWGMPVSAEPFMVGAWATALMAAYGFIIFWFYRFLNKRIDFQKVFDRMFKK